MKENANTVRLNIATKYTVHQLYVLRCHHVGIFLFNLWNKGRGSTVVRTL